MKGLILAAGRGTRLRPLTFTRPKPVIRIAGKPIIAFAVDNLIEAGITDIGVVVSPDTQEDIQMALRDYPGATITYVLQKQALGIAHAVGTAKEWLQGSPFVLYLGDNLFQAGIKPFVDAYSPESSAVIALVKVPDPRQFGVAVVEDGNIKQLLEKPKDPPSDLAVAGVYVFGPEIMAIVENLKPSARGEYEITDSIQALLDQGSVVKGLQIQGWWKDTGRPDDLLDSNRLLLIEQNPEPIVKCVPENSEITGRVYIEEGAVIRNSTILGPVHIGHSAVIENSYIGPYTSVGPKCFISNSELEFSIIEDAGRVEDVPLRLHGCILGVGAKVTKRIGLPRAHKLILGDLSVLELA